MRASCPPSAQSLPRPNLPSEPPSLLTFPALSLTLVLTFALAPFAAAQTAEIGGAAASAHGYAGSIAILDMRERDLTADLRFGVIPASSGAVDVVLHSRIARGATLGGVGAVTAELVAAARTDARGSMRLSGQAVLGPASVRLGLAAANAAPSAFTVTGLAPADATLRTAGSFVSIDATVRYRIDRTFLLSVEPTAAWGADGIAARGRASLRVRRLVEPFDGVLAVHSHLPAGGGAWSGAVGVGGIWAPRRAPEWHATVWLGWFQGMPTPGVTVEGVAALGPGVSLSIGLAAEPFRADIPAYRGHVDVQVDVGPHHAFARAEVEATQRAREAQVAIVTGFRFALDDAGSP